MTKPHWKLFHCAQQCLTQPKHKFICKFIHEWLLLQDQFHVQNASANNLFPSCHTRKETAEHFLPCPHAGHQTLWHDLHDQFFKLHITNKIAGPFQDHLLSWIAFGMAGPATPPNSIANWLNCTNLPRSRSIRMETTTLWQISQRMGSKPNSCIPTDQWPSILLMSSDVDMENSPTTMEIMKQTPAPSQPPWGWPDAATKNIVYQILHDVQNDPLLQDFLSLFELEVLLCWPTKYICQWIQNCTNHIKAQQKAFSRVSWRCSTGSASAFLRAAEAANTARQELAAIPFHA